MSAFNSELNASCQTILDKLSKRTRAFFKHLGYLAYTPSAKCCYATIPHIGLGLGNYGYKPIGRTQSKVAFGELKGLRLFYYTQPNRRCAYRIRLTELGIYLYCMLAKRISVVDYQKPTLEIPKTDPREYAKPTLLDIKKDLRKTLPIHISPSINSAPCNEANKYGSFSVATTRLLDSVSDEVLENILTQYKNYSLKSVIKNKDKVMEVIARRVISSQDEIDRLAKLDRLKSERMQIETKRKFQELDSTPVYSQEKKLEILAKMREGIRGCLA